MWIWGIFLLLQLPHIRLCNIPPARMIHHLDTSSNGLNPIFIWFMNIHSNIHVESSKHSASSHFLLNDAPSRVWALVSVCARLEWCYFRVFREVLSYFPIFIFLFVKLLKGIAFMNAYASEWMTFFSSLSAQTCARGGGVRFCSYSLSLFEMMATKFQQTFHICHFSNFKFLFIFGFVFWRVNFRLWESLQTFNIVFLIVSDKCSISHDKQ